MLYLTGHQSTPFIMSAHNDAADAARRWRRRCGRRTNAYGATSVGRRGGSRSCGRLAGAIEGRSAGRADRRSKWCGAAARGGGARRTVRRGFAASWGARGCHPAMTTHRHRAPERPRPRRPVARTGPSTRVVPVRTRSRPTTRFAIYGRRAVALRRGDRASAELSALPAPVPCGSSSWSSSLSGPRAPAIAAYGASQEPREPTARLVTAFWHGPPLLCGPSP